MPINGSGAVQKRIQDLHSPTMVKQKKYNKNANGQKLLSILKYNSLSRSDYLHFVRELSNIMTLRGGRGVSKPSVLLYGGWRSSKSSLTFIVTNKLNLRFILLYFRYMWRKEIAENIRIPSYRGGIQIAQKTVI